MESKILGQDLKILPKTTLETSVFWSLCFYEKMYIQLETLSTNKSQHDVGLDNFLSGSWNGWFISSELPPVPLIYNFITLSITQKVDKRKRKKIKKEKKKKK